jgi:hypothetical protein
VFLRGLCGEIDCLGRLGPFLDQPQRTRRGTEEFSSNLDLRAFLPSQERPCGASAAEGVADLGEVGGLVADVKDGGDRVGALGLDVEGHAGGEGVVGAAWLQVSEGQYFTGAV